MLQYEIVFEPSGSRVRVAAGTALIDAVRAAGLPIASACDGDGLCGRCGVALLEGAHSVPPETERERDAKTANRIDPGLRLACCVAVAGNLTIRAPYW